MKDKPIKLSKQEEKVVRFIKAGLKNKEIANVMNLSEKTVSSYIYRIYKKINLNRKANVIMLISRCIELGLI